MTTCPTTVVLRRYEAGELGESHAEPIEHHLTQCDICRAVMATVRADNAENRQTRELLGDLSDVGLSGDVLNAVPNGAGDAPSPVPSATGEAAARPLPGALFVAPKWQIPDYERIVLCGEGAYGSVWVVRDRVGVHRALKIIDLGRLRRAGVTCREREALEAYGRKISGHPYLISIFHVGVIGDLLYYTMELADDQTKRTSVGDAFPSNYRPLTLDTIIQGRRLRVDIAMEIARRLLRGLAKMHSVDLVHRDIKPSNIVFVHRHPKLADIGMVAADAYGSRLVGTPEYMSPDRVMDKTADVYAFGKVLYEMLVGPDTPSFPYLPDYQRWQESRWPLERVRAVLSRACADRGEDRYASATDMLEELEACCEPTIESLFEDLATPDHDDQSETTREAIRLGFAVVKLIPWILGLIAFLALLNWLPI